MYFSASPSMYSHSLSAWKVRVSPDFVQPGTSLDSGKNVVNLGTGFERHAITTEAHRHRERQRKKTEGPGQMTTAASRKWFDLPRLVDSRFMLEVPQRFLSFLCASVVRGLSFLSFGHSLQQNLVCRRTTFTDAGDVDGGLIF